VSLKPKGSLREQVEKKTDGEPTNPGFPRKRPLKWK